MSLTPNFTVSESIGTPSDLTFTDTSTGSDGTITTRRIYVQMADGTYLVQSGTTTDYEEWSYASSSITLTLLTRSVAANVTVQWLNGTTIVYTKTILYDFPLFDYVFAYQLTQQQTGNPGIIRDTNYYNNKVKLLVNLDDSEQAISIGSDIYTAQECLDINYDLIQNQNYYF